MKPSIEILVAAILLGGCSQDKSLKSTAMTYIVVKHVPDSDRYLIRHGNVEIDAICRFSTYEMKETNKTEPGHCVRPLPVGQEIKMARGEADWLIAEWEEAGGKYHMGLTVEKEELKGEK